MLENYIKLKASLNKTRFQGRSVRKYKGKKNEGTLECKRQQELDT